MKVQYIIFAYLALLCVGFMENSRGPIYSEFLDFFNINTQTGSFLFSLSSLSSFIATMSARFWIKKNSSLFYSIFSLFLITLSCFAFYFTVAQEGNLFFFLAMNCFYGMSIGILSITLNSLVSQNSTNENRSRYLSGLHSMYGLASLVAPFAVSYIYELNLSWASVFLVAGIFGALISLYGLSINKKTSTNESFEYNHAPSSLYIPIGLGLGLYVMSEVLVATRLSYFLEMNYDFSKENAALSLSLFFLLLFSGRLLFSFINPKIEKIVLLKTSLFISAILVTLGVYVWPILLAISAFSMSFFFPYYMGYIAQKYPQFEQDLFSKCMNFIGFLLFLGHWFYGVIADVFSTTYAMSLPILFLLSSLYILHFVLTKLSLKSNVIPK